MSKRILTVGSAYVEFAMGVDVIPTAGETTIESEMGFDYLPGGRGANAAIAAARLGADSIFCAKIGNDTYGEQLRELYVSAGIDARFVSSHGEKKTGLSVRIFEAAGRQRSVVYPGANLELNDFDVEDAFISYPDIVFLGLDSSYESISSSLTYAAEQGVPTVVFSNSLFTEFPLSRLNNPEIFIVDESELGRYTKNTPSSIENTLRAAMDISGAVKAKYYVIKLGERAAFIYDGKYYNIAPAPDVSLSGVHDTGDCFGAALAYEYAKSRDIDRACTYANIVAVMSAGNESSAMPVPTGAEVGKFIAEHNIKF